MTQADEALQFSPLPANARAKAGLSDFVDESFIEPLTRLLDSYRNDAALSGQDIEGTRVHLVDMLVTRLQIVDALKRHPKTLQDECPILGDDQSHPRTLGD